MKFKRFTALICSALLALCSTTMLSASAQTTGYVIDNDPLASSGYHHIYGGFTYHSFSGSYNGDARRAPTNSGAFYGWCHEQKSFIKRTVNYAFQAYLNHSTFNDPAAEYLVNTDGTLDSLCIINQATAPSGFCSTRTATLSASLIQQVRLHPSTRNNYNAGADAISIKYTYAD